MAMVIASYRSPHTLAPRARPKWPMPIPWKLHCSFEGIDVVFIYGGGEDDRIKVDLTGAAFSDEECKRLAPTIAEKVVAILQQQ